MKSYKKKKAKPNSPGPGFRTSDNFINKHFSKGSPRGMVKRTSFKTQHRG